VLLVYITSSFSSIAVLISRTPSILMFVLGVFLTIPFYLDADIFELIFLRWKDFFIKGFIVKYGLIKCHKISNIINQKIHLICSKSYVFEHV
jgi:hypothetical protein